MVCGSAPASDGHKALGDLRIYYATQVAANPPTIVLITNGPELFDNTYQRYLLKTFRDLGATYVSIRAAHIEPFPIAGDPQVRGDTLTAAR